MRIGPFQAHPLYHLAALFSALTLTLTDSNFLDDDTNKMMTRTIFFAESIFRYPILNFLRQASLLLVLLLEYLLGRALEKLSFDSSHSHFHYH